MQSESSKNNGVVSFSQLRQSVKLLSKNYQDEQKARDLRRAGSWFRAYTVDKTALDWVHFIEEVSEPSILLQTTGKKTSKAETLISTHILQGAFYLAIKEVGEASALGACCLKALNVTTLEDVSEQKIAIAINETLSQIERARSNMYYPGKHNPALLAELRNRYVIPEDFTTVFMPVPGA